MARKNTKNTGWGLWLIGGVVLLIALLPREVWIALAAIAVLLLMVYAYSKSTKGKKPSDASPPVLHDTDDRTLSELLGNPSSKRGDISRLKTPRASLTGSASTTSGSEQSVEPEFYSARLNADPGSTHSFGLPRRPDGFAKARWVPAGETIEVANTAVPGGMLYAGRELKSANGCMEPSLINSHLKVARHGDFREKHTNYWPSYADITPTARRAYLTWLAEGRSHPACDIGLVFLYFYGLERRVILDTSKDVSDRVEWPQIAAELRRLLTVYGERSNSLRRYAGELLNWIELNGIPNALYLKPIPDLPPSYELPAYLRVALGQAAVDRAPLPAELAFAWVKLNPGTSLRTPATRCPDEFQLLFTQRYQEALGAGLILPKNRTKLQFVYQAASAGFRGTRVTLSLGDLPDVTALTDPIRTLMEIANRCTDELAPFSRLVIKDATARTSLDGMLQLPATLWPPEGQARLETLKGRLQAGTLTQRLDELVSGLGGSNTPFGRESTRALSRALASIGIGFEPDVLTGARAPAGSDSVVLFALPTGDPTVPDVGAYQTAALTLQLASAVAQADGEFNDQEVQHLRQEIERWTHLTERSRIRLKAHLAWLAASPVTLASLKKKLDPLELKAKEAIATFMATLAQSDGVVSPGEVKFLEKVYKALGVEPKRVFSDIHAVASGTATPARAVSTGFRLDPERIAALAQDTARVSALLSNIFAEEEVAPIKPVDVEPIRDTGLLGLDEAHSALVRLMLSRPQWSRAELEDAVADLELMLDGALEQVNEASFTAYDLPLSEGEDPIDINTDLVERVEQ